MGGAVQSVHDVDAIVKQKEFLKEWMDPDFGLLSKLRAKNALSEDEIDEIKDQHPYRKRNSKLVHLILLKKKFKELIEALRDASQTHVANYLIANGDYDPKCSGDWPIGTREVSIIDANEERLVDIIDTCDLLVRLFSAGVINRRQMEFISSKPTFYEKNEELLKIVRRCSLSKYWQTIKCLHASNQTHIAEILEKGGVLVQTDVTLDAVGVKVDEAEEQIVAGISNMLGNRSLPESNRILELVQLRLVGAKLGHSVALYFHCLELREVDRLQEICESGQMRDVVETVFNRLIKTNVNVKVTIKWRVDVFRRSRHFFKVFDPAKQKLGRSKTHRRSQVIPRQTCMYDLPLELVDLILEKSYLSFMLTENEWLVWSEIQDLFKTMASVDWCWHQRLKKQRFKRRIWRRLAAFMKDTDKFAIYRINQLYFVENIQAKVLISHMRSADCLTDAQARLLNIEKNRRGKAKRGNTKLNSELLHVVRSFHTEIRYSAFIRCLRQSNQNIVAKIAQNGGGTCKILQ